MGSLAKNAMVLVVTVTGWGVDLIYTLLKQWRLLENHLNHSKLGYSMGCFYEKKTYDIPLYWLFKKDPYFMVFV